MARTTFPWLILGVVLAGGLPAQEKTNVMQAPPAGAAAAATGFVRLEAFDFAALVPPPPAAGSVAALADLEAVRQVQAWRTPEQVAWAKVIEQDSVFNLAAELGAWFSAARLPVTAAFFQRIGVDLRGIDAAAKKPFLRPRPVAVDPGVQPCVNLPASTSYPSGSGLQAFVWAELLADMLPERRERLLARAHRAAWGRVIGGVHFPSDVVAGRRLAPIYLAEARRNPAFREAFEACRREIQSAARE